MPFAAIGAGAGALGGFLGSEAQQDATTAAGDAKKAAMNAMIAKLDSVGMPPDQSAAIILNQYKQAGLYTPELEQQVKDSVSQYSQIKTDTAARNMQVQALNQMSQYGKAGLTPDEMAQSRAQQLQVQQANNSNQQAIIQNMAQRGQQGSGAEIASRLGASQNAANTGSAAADQISSIAAQRALQAIGQSGQMAGQLNAADFNQAATKAGASDEMNRFNTQNQMALNQRNTASANQGQAANLANLQNINNTNVQQNNQEKYNQLQRQRQNWQDKLAYAQSYSQPLTGYGNAAAEQAIGMGNAKANMWSSLGAGASAGLSGMGKKGSSGDEEDDGGGGGGGGMGSLVGLAALA